MKPSIETNELFACDEILADHPVNTYWKARRDLAQMNFDERAGVEVDEFLFYCMIANMKVEPPNPEKCLNDMTPEEQRCWFANCPEVEI